MSATPKSAFDVASRGCDVFCRRLRSGPNGMPTDPIPQYGESAEEKRVTSPTSVPPRPNYDSNHRQWQVAGWAPKSPLQNRLLVPTTIFLAVCGAMRNWFHSPFGLLFAPLAAKPVAGQCPSYTEYSKVPGTRSRLTQY